MKRNLDFWLIIGLLIILTGCAGNGNGAENKNNTVQSNKERKAEASKLNSVKAHKNRIIKIGVIAEGEVQFAIIKSQLEALGYTVKDSSFKDTVKLNDALAKKDIDISWCQSEINLQSYNGNKGTDFVLLQPKTYFPLFAMYSNRWKSLGELPDGAAIVICSDAQNQSRGLNLLRDYGLIEVNEGVAWPSIYDIKSNPHNFNFIEAESSILTQSINEVDAVCLEATRMLEAGLPCGEYLCSAKDNESYALGFTVRAEDKNAKWAKEVAQAAECEELAKYCRDEKKESLIPCWQ